MQGHTPRNDDDTILAPSSNTSAIANNAATTTNITTTNVTANNVTNTNENTTNATNPSPTPVKLGSIPFYNIDPRDDFVPDDGLKSDFWWANIKPGYQSEAQKKMLKLMKVSQTPRHSLTDIYIYIYIYTHTHTYIYIYIYT
jgi:hypothetical protein